jgi:hypothetical protein
VYDVAKATDTMSRAEENYKNSFGLGTPRDKEKTKEALHLALDIRKFEIGLYWQRAAYFWTLIAVAFAGYFAILSAEKLPDREYLAYIVSCIGFTFTWAWYLVNRGSKYWQENWENHVDMLEDEVVGPLYKTLLHRPTKKRSFFEKRVLGPEAISVSKVNLMVSLFTLSIWLVLLFHSLPPFHRTSPISYKRIVVGIMTFFFVVVVRLGTKTSMGPHKHVVTSRETEIVGE